MGNGSPGRVVRPLQAGHLVFNLRNLLDPGVPPFPAPAEGWSAQLVSFLNGMAAADALNAVLALVFVYGYFARARWHGWLGTLTLTVSMYAAAVFTDGTVVAGAWTSHLGGYLPLYLPFVPVVALFAWWSARGVRAGSGQVAASGW
jgi:hypothetical protein